MVFAKMPRFPEKLWTVATTDPTGSVWFNEAGDKLLIDWSLFELHYVGRFLIFAIKLQTIKTQLYHYGFHQFYCGSSLLQNSRRSSTTLRGYQHPDFHRDQPEWLSRMHKKRYGWKPSTDHSYAYGIYTNNNCDGSQVSAAD